MAFLKTKSGVNILIDPELLPFLGQFTWSIGTNGYPRTAFFISKKPRTIELHRIVMGFPRLQVDHQNLDKLDNRKCNLRLATPTQNTANRPGRGKSGFKGVIVQKKTGLIYAKVGSRRNGGIKYLGPFKSLSEAAKAYDQEAILRYGQFAFLNFPGAKP